MTQQNDKIEPPPAVETPRDDDDLKPASSPQVRTSVSVVAQNALVVCRPFR